MQISSAHQISTLNFFSDIRRAWCIGAESHFSFERNAASVLVSVKKGVEVELLEKMPGGSKI